MPIKEALFWFGITVFGTGLFFVVEGNNMPFAVALTVVGFAAIAYSVYAHYRLGAPKIPLWIGLLVITWGAIGYDVYDRHHYGRSVNQDQNAADVESGIYLKSWGVDANTLLAVGGRYTRAKVDGHKLRARTSITRVAVICARYDATVDPLEVTGWQKSAVFIVRRYGHHDPIG